MLGAARATRVAHVLRTTQRHASHGPKTYGKGEFRGFTPPHVPMWQKRVGEGFATAAWLWFFWRCYHDGGHLVVSTKCRPCRVCAAGPSTRARAPGRTLRPPPLPSTPFRRRACERTYAAAVGERGRRRSGFRCHLPASVFDCWRRGCCACCLSPAHSSARSHQCLTQARRSRLLLCNSSRPLLSTAAFAHFRSLVKISDDPNI